MTSSTITGYLETLMNYQWSYFWDETSSKTWANTSGTAVYVSPAMWLGFAGGGIAFLLNLLGSLHNTSQLIVYVEYSVESWVSGYVGGTYVDIMDDIKTSAQMQQLLLAFTIDLITYTFTSFLHSIYLMFVGFIGAMYIFYKMGNYQTTNGYDMDLYYGWRCLVLGSLLGAIGYFGGYISANTVSSIMSSLGFISHSNIPTGNEDISQTDGTNTNSISAETDSTPYDYKKFLLLQENWDTFFLIQRSMQLIAPYLLYIVLDVTQLGVLIYLFIFV